MESQLTNRELRIQKKIKDSETHVFKAVFPGQTNHHNTMFGGAVMYIMDEIAFMTATRFCRKPIVTVSSDKIDFNHPIPAGTLVELIGTVVRVGRTSLDVRVDVFVESMYRDGREKAMTGTFTLVAINESKRPVPVFDEVEE
ncbi:acyl-CoA thioesterase [Myroides marinus]|jgi:acyl-CoA hydrolase|uniref:Acyl-CoA hydrolase n=1 Tax=Myroides marinus TaxID=703342 RepID=A0A163ZIT6_9FLAO|nr:acyl-CoA thioesterase [Myroides marinus]MDR0195707.1 acyl-CoA thioesterase [Myroides sp.]KUF38247.1 acyl-CoA thioesterase [Myroides marinus]KZE81847.1 acyl-CoA thioesterase [Myroides marinus]MDM1347775.1 acyl-CoA thioesterase [Myroides marinus]MDM1351415.1 acyl-CoA thioesterase [Myroides marinus]